METLCRTLKITVSITVALSLKVSYGMVLPNQNRDWPYHLRETRALLGSHYPNATLRELGAVLDVLNFITRGTVPAASRNAKRNFQLMLRLFYDNMKTIRPYLPLIILEDADGQPITTNRRALEITARVQNKQKQRRLAKFNKTFEIHRPE
ncbi:MAG: hypothetical protein LBG04_00505 [Holosporaceae bacterium]|jgi:PAS domain-containing protein|nr:hypothetical protein [Holosporaceae bacterium]